MCNLLVVNTSTMEKPHRALYLIPRILVILAILFVSLFALDSFSPERTFFQNLGAFMIHLIPSFLLIIVLIIAWKWEMTGGIILTILGLFFSVFLFVKNISINHSVLTSLLIVLFLSLPFVISGILFIIHSNKKKNSGYAK